MKFLIIFIFCISAFGFDLISLERKAENGDIPSQWELYYIYKNGYSWLENYKEISIPPIFAKRKYWLEKLSKKDIKAMYLLAELYMTGYTWQLEADVKMSFYWWKKAADKGDAHALMRVGTYYEQGVGCKKSLFSAKWYYTEAIKKGDQDAVILLQRLENKLKKREVIN